MDRKLLDYLPPVLREVLEFQAINAANEPEISIAWDALALVLANQFLDTATASGVAVWERELNIRPKDTDTLEVRKARIKALWNLELPYTLPWLKNWLTGLCGEPVLLGSLNFLQDMGVVIPEGTMVNQAVYAAIDGQLCAVFAISYAKMRSAAAGLVTLCGHRSVTPVVLCGDFMLTESFLQSKFGVKTRRIVFPTREVRNDLLNRHPDPDAPTLAITTRDELVSAAYAVTGARSLRSAATLGTVIHLIGGILGMLTMLALGYLGSTELLTPTNVLLYQLIWMIPGFLVTEWTRAV